MYLLFLSFFPHNGDMIERDTQPDEELTSPIEQEEERSLEVTLRPKTLADFIGQSDMKEGLTIFMEAAKARQEPLEHVLLYGNPGLGKTTLAHVIASEMGGNIRVTSGPALERVGDLAAILSNLKEGDILFIDEIHRLNKLIEEVLYPAMEDYVLDIVVGKGPTARTLRLNLERFTLIGATTRLSLLSAPMRDRFGATHQLSFYTEHEIAEIVRRNASLLEVTLDEEAVLQLATRARQTPRIANRLLKRLRDFAQVKGDGHVSKELAIAAFELLGVDRFGLDAVDRRILEAIIEKFQGGPVGLSTLAASTQEELDTIEEVYEPFLLQNGFLERTPRGRTATKRAYQHLGKPLL
ncbi:MAG: Holliday junction ATP-dependent DNA helicase RuvB [Candidatus Giovannonibacteria bacterium GW2011_GWA2_53_7]|uniref:Holliday junction branch migration complex subunit RuvB n=1 Tax=Candidatus Giovannonibacteria bacterium GW2011_GWA2_53_7 TaxID=1618650 RepID=A0A0G2A336_9BACT|nr:MAG: Holliday junction ATP-dependent DNA helicase RuvB [Candidatus Giovannonibacteria bacterium GW2011_GWA2_53_7]